MSHCTDWCFIVHHLLNLADSTLLWLSRGKYTGSIHAKLLWKLFFSTQVLYLYFIQIYYERSMIRISFGSHWIAHSDVIGQRYEAAYISYSTCIFGTMIFSVRIFNEKRFGYRQSTAYLNRGNTNRPHNKDTPYCTVVILTWWYILEDIQKN
jgi:hypothetical protein